MTRSTLPLALLAPLALAMLLSSPTRAHAQATDAAPPNEHEPEASPQRFEAPSGAPAGSSAHTVALTPGLEVFARYALTARETADGRTWDHAFDVPRVHAALSARYDGATARVVLEGVRSTTSGALVGVATDSVLLRLREASVGYRAFDDALDLQLGLVPLLTIPALEGAWGLRAIASTPLEESNLAAPADLGARATLRLPARLGWVGGTVSSGEGYTSRELNRGKNTEVAAELHALAPVAPALGPLALFVSGVYGSQGVASSRAHRVTAGLLWRGDFRETGRTDAAFSAGALVTLAWGVDDVGAREALLWELFARGEPVRRLLLGARLVHLVRERSAPDDRVTTLIGTVGYRLAKPLELYLALTRAIPTSAARAALPGSDLWDLALTARFVL